MARPKKPPIEVKSHGVKNRVPQGQSARMARGRAAKEKADDNKRRVQEINERDADVFVVAATAEPEADARRARAAVATDDPDLAEALAHSGSLLDDASDTSDEIAIDATTGSYKRNGAWWRWFKLVEAEGDALTAWRKARRNHEVRKLADPKFKGRFTEKRPATPNLDRFDAIKFIEARASGDKLKLSDERIAELADAIKLEETNMPTATATRKASGRKQGPASQFAEAANSAKKKVGGPPPRKHALAGQALMDHIVKLVKAHPAEKPVLYRRYTLFADKVNAPISAIDECVAAALKGKTDAPKAVLDSATKATGPKATVKKAAAKKAAANGKARAEKRQAKKVAKSKSAAPASKREVTPLPKKATTTKKTVAAARTRKRSARK